ncbi:MAG: hypothetical protein GY811_27490 [Myxococcales bacterium]|nr:hypothetical protein [Myxococcales bacterium]
MLRFLATTLALATLAFTGACASSAGKNGPRVVVMPISGSDSAQSAVDQVVNRRYELVSDKKYRRAASRLDAKSKDSKDIRRVSRKLDIDAVVTGEMVKKGKKKYELRLVLRAGDSGKEFDSLTIKLKSKRLKKGDVKKVRKKLYSALSVVDSWDRADDESSSRSRRSSSKSSKREMDRARKMRERKHDKTRRDEDRRAERDDERSAKRDRDREKRDRKRSKKDRRKEEKLAHRRAEEEKDEARDSERRSKRSKKSKKKSKKRKRDRDDRYEVVTVRDESGQALDEEDPF